MNKDAKPIIKVLRSSKDEYSGMFPPEIKSPVLSPEKEYRGTFNDGIDANENKTDTKSPSQGELRG